MCVLLSVTGNSNKSPWRFIYASEILPYFKSSGKLHHPTFSFSPFMASFHTDNPNIVYAPAYVWDLLLALSCQGFGVCIRRIPCRVKMVLFNMQQNKALELIHPVQLFAMK